ncbi:ATP-binding protein [Streptomyces sp. NPDC021356]|uniref:ATP-binding protein n=1 Tax=Streptomyces sp. NPDC021356 TaxID=3154900 RepID=UPI00340C81D2
MTATQSPLTVHRFAMRFSSTPRGARLARRLCGHRLDAWGLPYGTAAHDVITLVAAELCANAVRHGHVSGRDFHVLLTASAATCTVRIEVTGTRRERLPHRAAAPVPGDEPRDSGRGLILVDALADRWGWTPRADGGPGKTVWAQCTAPHLR